MKYILHWIIGIIILILFLALLNSYLIIKSTQTSENIPTNHQPSKITINNHIFNLEIASTSLEKSIGLMHRTQLNKDTGMLFIFENEKPQSFWMKNTLIPLDLIFINSNNNIVDIKHNFQPCNSDPCETYTSSQPASYVLEINGGLVKDLNIEIGQQVNIN